jgi:hypothetical protein
MQSGFTNYVNNEFLRQFKSGILNSTLLSDQSIHALSKCKKLVRKLRDIFAKVRNFICRRQLPEDLGSESSFYSTPMFKIFKDNVNSENEIN